MALNKRTLLVIKLPDSRVLGLSHYPAYIKHSLERICK